MRNYISQALKEFSQFIDDVADNISENQNNNRSCFCSSHGSGRGDPMFATSSQGGNNIRHAKSSGHCSESMDIPKHSDERPSIVYSAHLSKKHPVRHFVENNFSKSIFMVSLDNLCPSTIDFGAFESYLKRKEFNVFNIDGYNILKGSTNSRNSKEHVVEKVLFTNGFGKKFILDLTFKNGNSELINMYDGLYDLSQNSQHAFIFSGLLEAIVTDKIDSGFALTLTKQINVLMSRTRSKKIPIIFIESKSLDQIKELAKKNHQNHEALFSILSNIHDDNCLSALEFESLVLLN